MAKARAALRTGGVSGATISLVAMVKKSDSDKSSRRQLEVLRSDGLRQRFLRGIVTAEIALALVLVVGAGLLTQSFGRMLQVDPGLQSDGVLTTRVSLPASSYSTPEEIRQFYDSLHRELLELPEVVAAGGVRRLPLRESAFMEVFMKEDEFFVINSCKRSYIVIAKKQTLQRTRL